PGAGPGTMPPMGPGMAPGMAAAAAPIGNTCAALKLEFLDAAGRPVASRVARQQVRLQQWRFLALAGRAPAGAVSAVIYLRVMGRDEVWFDDVELVRSQPPPALILTPERMVVGPDETPTVHLQATAAGDVPEKAKVTVQLTGPKGKAVKGVTGDLERKDARTVAGDMTLPKLPPGRYAWDVKVGSDMAEADLFVALDKRQPKNLNPRGVLLQADGQPIFPIGIYHAAVSDYKAIAAQGFNMVQGLGTHNATQQRTAVEEAGTHKLHVQIPLHTGGLVGANLKSSAEKMAYFRKHATVLDWKIADEPEAHPETLREVPDVYAALKQKGDLHPLLLTVRDPEQYAFWAHFCDSLQVVAFPLPDEPLTLVADRVRAARQALAPWQHLSVVLPAGYRAGAVVQPTLDQARLMVYLAVIAGAKGVWWYAFKSPGYDLVESELWKQFGKLNEETAALGEAVTGGAETPLQSDNAKLQAGAWRSGDKLKIAVANPTPEAQTAVLKLEAQIAKAEVSRGGGQVAVRDGAVAVTLKPGEVGLIMCAVGQ
ncbi:MAG: hypothetical protein KKI08_27840, partial [Armatimonadetes bacterium]|nr:hypothetical protein [Armatimonadota bacterium]